MMTTPTAKTTGNIESPHDALRMADHNFPSRLYRFLEEVEVYGSSHIASWQPHGRGFRIHKPKVFVKIEAPSWFVYKKYSSFQRQLHIYGFHRITKGVDKNCYYHEHFLRGHYHLIPKITRCPVKNSACPLTLATNTPEPDFYSMVPLSGSATRSQRIGRDSSSDGPSTDCVTSTDRVKPQPVSQFIQNHFTDARNTSRGHGDTKSKQDSGEALPAIPPQQMNSSIFALLERLQGMSATPDVTVTVSTHNNNHQVSITSQRQRENMSSVTDHPPHLSQSETNILSQLLLQAEQNRVQLQRLVNQVQSSQATCQDQQQQNAISAPAVLQNVLQGPTNYRDDLEQNKLRLATALSNEQIVCNTIALLAAPPSSQNVSGGVHYEGSLSSLTAAGRNALTSTSLIVPNRLTNTSDTSNDTHHHGRDNTVSAANLQTLSYDEQVRLRNLLWNVMSK